MDKQTGQKLYAPNLSMQVHKKVYLQIVISNICIIFHSISSGRMKKLIRKNKETYEQIDGQTNEEMGGQCKKYNPPSTAGVNKTMSVISFTSLFK